MRNLTETEKVELLDILYGRLDTIIDDPDSADQFETEKSLAILEDKIKNDKYFNQDEINWIMEEARNRDDIPAMVRIAKLFVELTDKPVITAIQRPSKEVSVIWSETGRKNGADYAHSQHFQFNDGGRAEGGFKGMTGDCVCRAVSIASGLPYNEVYEILANGNATQRQGKRKRRMDGVKSAGHGINVKRKWFQEYMKSIGFEWIPTMFIGQGCKVHLRGDELPKGKLVITVSGHYTSMIDGVLMDTYDCSRQGTRCVYGYFIKK